MDGHESGGAGRAAATPGCSRFGERIRPVRHPARQLAGVFRADARAVDGLEDV